MPQGLRRTVDVAAVRPRALCGSCAFDEHRSRAGGLPRRMRRPCPPSLSSCMSAAYRSVCAACPSPGRGSGRPAPTDGRRPRLYVARAGFGSQRMPLRTVGQKPASSRLDYGRSRSRWFVSIWTHSLGVVRRIHASGTNRCSKEWDLSASVKPSDEPSMCAPERGRHLWLRRACKNARRLRDESAVSLIHDGQRPHVPHVVAP